MITKPYKDRLVFNINVPDSPIGRKNLRDTNPKQPDGEYPIDQSILHLVSHKVLTRLKMTWVVNIESAEDIIEGKGNIPRYEVRALQICQFFLSWSIKWARTHLL